MTGIMGIPRCGGCRFAKIVHADLTKRLCHGAPPSAIQIPAPSGKMTLQMARPIVSVTDEACSLFQSKSAVDHQRDANAMQQLHVTGHDEMAERGITKQ